MKRLFSILLAIVMISAVFMTGCSNNAPAVDEHDHEQDHTEVVFPDNVVAYVGDYEITKDEFAIYVDMAVMNVQQYIGNAPGWEETLGSDGITARDSVLSLALNEAWKLNSFLGSCTNNGLYTAEKDEEFFKTTVEDFGGEELFAETIENAGFSEDAYKKYISCIGAYTALVESICSKEDANAIYNDKYITAKHILLNFEGRESEEKTLEEINAVYDRVKNGENFEELIKELGEDPGQNPETGYTFPEGVMVDEFYQGALKLEIGAVSEPVKTSYGYHIIKRYENPAEGSDEYEYNLMNIQTTELNNYLTEETVETFKNDYPLSVNEDMLRKLDLSKYTAEISTDTVAE